MGLGEEWGPREDEAAEKGWGPFETRPGKTLDVSQWLSTENILEKPSSFKD